MYRPTLRRALVPIVAGAATLGVMAPLAATARPLYEKSQVSEANDTLSAFSTTKNTTTVASTKNTTTVASTKNTTTVASTKNTTAVASTKSTATVASTPAGATNVALSAMRFGYTAQPTANESGAQAITRQIATYGPGVVRVYFPGTPAPWSRITPLTHGLPSAVSFKMRPQDVNRGVYDSVLREWFRTAPTDRTTWWSFHPEPEDDIMAGSYSMADFRSAYARIAGLEHQANNPKLVSTWMIMCWTVRPGSGRDWRNYWPGNDNVDALGFDCANKGIKSNTYSSPATMLDEPVALARSLGKPWGLGEFGSQLASGDNGTNRGAWLVAMARYLQVNGSSFAMYFDADRTINFKLYDAASKAAWRSVVIDQVP